MSKIMIFDNDVTVQLDLEEYFKESHHHLVGIVGNEKEAVRVTEEMLPDIIILMEIDLPGKRNGIDVAENIRNRIDVGIVFMTVCADFDVIYRAKQVSPLAYVLKPFDEKQILATAEIALANQSTLRELRSANLNLERRIAEQEVELFSQKGGDDDYPAIPYVNDRFLDDVRISSIGRNKWRFTP